MLAWRCWLLMFPHFQNSFNMATWQGHIALQMAARNGKPDVYQHLYCQKRLLCIFQLFQKLDSTKFIFRTFHSEPWMKISSCVTDVRREILLVCTTVLSWHVLNTTMPHGTVWEARRLKMGTIWFSSDCEHNLTCTQSITGNIIRIQSTLWSGKWGYTFSSANHTWKFTHDTITRSQVSRSLFVLKRG